jgi:hypothetical protein
MSELQDTAHQGMLCSSSYLCFFTWHSQSLPDLTFLNQRLTIRSVTRFVHRALSAANQVAYVQAILMSSTSFFVMRLPPSSEEPNEPSLLHPARAVAQSLRLFGKLLEYFLPRVFKLDLPWVCRSLVETVFTGTKRSKATLP